MLLKITKYILLDNILLIDVQLNTFLSKIIPEKTGHRLAGIPICTHRLN